MEFKIKSSHLHGIFNVMNEKSEIDKVQHLAVLEFIQWFSACSNNKIDKFCTELFFDESTDELFFTKLFLIRIINNLEIYKIYEIMDFNPDLRIDIDQIYALYKVHDDDELKKYEINLLNSFFELYNYKQLFEFYFLCYSINLGDRKIKYTYYEQEATDLLKNIWKNEEKVNLLKKKFKKKYIK